MIKTILATVCGFILLVLSYLVFIYLFTKPAKPLMEYEFTTMTYPELEENISKITTNSINAEFNLTQKELLNKETTSIRKIVLGKDSLQFGFITKMDKGYEFKTKDNHLTESSPWLELIIICDSKGKHIVFSRKNRDEHPKLVKLFEDEFIKKINNGKIEVINRGFWNWF
ncbi:hypothetical protein HNQ02_003849 [Flavobacterium sp. 7E]|uniref:hypothetical protein n=1 Tax=Flavobacterium sp. 7E TaxID=2735898 RepID=UPI00156EBDE1|nr:hypothetical protein [Flavobacterium sp. 7E]NRS90898.1 hypothetical protein [Flavobacterium sp. 7E]